MNPFILPILGRILGFAAYAAIKSLGIALIVFSTAHPQNVKNFIKPHTESTSIQSSLNISHDNRILKGDSINTAILPLR